MDLELREARKGRILASMNSDEYRPLTLKELAIILSVPKTDVNLLKEILDELELKGEIYKSGRNRYGLPRHFNLIPGKLQMSEKGFGFVIPDDPNEKDIHVSPKFLNGAMHNDRVMVRRIAYNEGKKEDKRDEGEIVKVFKRANETLVGTFIKRKRSFAVIPDEKRITENILVPADQTMGASQGQKVVVKITKWPGNKSSKPKGQVVEILGSKNDPMVDVLSIIKTLHLPEKFPEEVLKQAERIENDVTEEMIKGRRDLRNMKIFTIDGEDAKDLDDAVSIEKTPDGLYRLGVHIADVSHYVKENSPLDKEALKRGTSIYLINTVIPMLPPKLSNGICSLNPGVNRLTFSVFMNIDRNGNVVSHEIVESVIKTVERMTYTNVYKILHDNDPELCNRYSHILDDLRLMEELALILRQKRINRGAMDFNFGEARILMDNDGKIIDIIRFNSTIAEKIIEEFMIVCNETVAEYFYWLDSPFVYRIHENPDKEKLLNFSNFVKLLGYRIKGLSDIHPKALQKLLEEVKGKKEERLISTMMLRSLQKARYSEQNVGHFGLASKYYCHFTSPIRRYPDLIIHRIMKKMIKGEMSEEERNRYIETLPDIALHCSERERVAEDAERMIEDAKKVEYMQQFIGDVFEGIITGITNFGIFVELDNTVEGVVRLTSLEDDYYILDDMGYFLKGERTGKEYKIGDVVNVRVVRADRITRQIEFVLEEE